MIDAKELKFGNYVEHEGKILPVCSIQGDNTIRLLENGKSIGCYRLSITNPIPLTEEILLKCGGDRVQEFKFNIGLSKDVKLSLIQKGDAWMVYLYSPFGMVKIRSIKSLHELQNIVYAVTGKELNAKL